MTEFRKNFEKLKQDYDSVKYPGDLSAEVPLGPSIGVMRWQLGGMLALAAAVAIAMTVWMMMPDRDATETIVQKPTPEVLPDVNQSIEEESTGGEASLTVAMPSVQRQSIEVPTWGGVTSEVQSSLPASMPYQSLSMPTMSEIDSAISSTAEQSS